MTEPTHGDQTGASAGEAPSAGVLDELDAAFGSPSQPGETSPSIIVESLVPEATRRSDRRSRREAKREAKQQAKRVAALEKEAKRAAKRARKAAKNSPSDSSTRQPDVDVVGARGTDDDVGVRIIEGDPSTTGTGDEAAGASDRGTIAIDDDGLPDPVYIEGELGEGGSATVLTGAGADQRSTVFIDDRGPGTGEIVTIDVATSAARMEPRMRERRIAVKRAVGRKRLKWVAVGCAVVGVVVAVLGVLGSGLFEISTVEVEGAVYSRGDALDAVVAELEGANVLRVDTAAAERTLEAIPWVDAARVTTDFPHGATIEIRERRPSVA